jgi:hypothetical protein
MSMGLHSSQPRRSDRLQLISSHFRRFGLTIHTGSKRKGEDSKTEAIHFPRPGHHRLLIWRTSKSTPTALCPFASSSNT